jgi:hypothetical protein
MKAGWSLLAFAALASIPALAQTVTVSPASLSFGDQVGGYYEFGPESNPEKWSELGDYYHQHHRELIRLCGYQ